MKTVHRARCRSGLLLVLPSLIGLAVLYVAPFFAGLYYTFTQGVAEPRFAGLDNFRELLGNSVFRQAAGNTAAFLAAGVPLSLGTALLFGIAAAKRRFSWQRWALLLPLAVPSASLALGWQRLWGAGGLAARLAGAPESGLLYGPAAFWLLLALYLLKNVGYLSVILTGSILALPAVYAESYRLDSSSEWGYVRHVLLPLISPNLLFAAVVAVMNYFLLFRDVYALYGDDPPGSVYMLQHFMNSNFYRLNYQRLSAAAFLTVLAMAALIAAVLWLQRRLSRDVG